MALTTLSKVIIGAIVLGGGASVAWNLAPDKFKGKVSTETATVQEDSSAAVTTATSPTPVAVSNSGGSALGSARNPLKVSLVSFHGYAPALVANGNSLTTKAGSIYAKNNVNVEFLIQDDIPTLSTLFTSGVAQCAWRTSDFWAQEQPNLRNAKLDARAVMIVDNTQGADAVITRNPNVRSIEDLAEKKVALLEFTPSHGMLIDALENSSLTARKRSSVDNVFIQAASGTAGVRSAFEAGHVDAAVLWDPDLALALKAVPGSRVIYSTKSASNLIFDVMVCDSRVLNNPANQNAIQAFVTGWMQGVDAAKANPDAAVEALVQTEEAFTLLAKQEGKGFIKSLFPSLIWTGLNDNARILGLAGDTNHYERVYRSFDRIYRELGALSNPNSPVINPAESFDYRYINKLLAANNKAKEEAAKPQFTFTQSGLNQAAAKTAEVTKPVNVSFTTGSAELSKRAQKTLDDQLAPFIENNGSAYFEVSGNTDSTGNFDANVRLSYARAQSVVDYLVKEWEFPVSRFKIVGNGPNLPLCNESNPASEGLSLEDCRALNRTTRVGVFGR